MKDSFVLYASYMQHVKMLSLEQRGELFTAILEYASGYASEELPEMDEVTQMAFSFIKADMDKNEEKYLRTVEARSEAGKRGGRPKANASEEKQKKQMLSEESNEKQKNHVYVNEYVDVNDNEKEIVKEKRRFTPPTRDEVQAYIQENRYSVDADKFIDFYVSKGWMVGRNKMKDWKAAVRNWARAPSGRSAGSKFNNFSPSGENMDDIAHQIMATQ